MTKEIGFGIFVCVLILAGALFFARSTTPNSTPVSPTQSPPRPQNPIPTQTPDVEVSTLPFVVNGHTYINGSTGAAVPGKQRQINTLLTTRKGDTVYQAAIRYEPQVVPITAVPDLQEVAKVFAARSARPLPDEIARVDEETEMILINLGETQRSVMSYHAYVYNGTILAYDLAQSSGGQAQHFIGRLSKDGVYIVSQRGSQFLENRDVPFATRTTQFPVEIELMVHQLYQYEKPKLKPNAPGHFFVFVPGFMNTLSVLVKPLPDETISVGSANYECICYEVRAQDAQASDRSLASQRMWFDKVSGFLLKRLDVDPGTKISDAPVTERASEKIPALTLSQLRPLSITPPTLPNGVFPYPLNTDLSYSIKNGEQPIGSLLLNFTEVPSGIDSKGAFVSKAQIDMNIVTDKGMSNRQECALTFFNESWQPIHYDTEGEETTDLKSKYHISAHTQNEVLKLSLSRQLSELASTPHTPTPAPAPIPTELTSAPNSEWKDPLLRVPFSDEDAQSQFIEQQADSTRILTRDYERVFMKGMYLYDFNRVEQLAAFAFRFPLPAIQPVQPVTPATDPNTATPNEKNIEPVAPRTYQSVAIVSVRQNRCGVVQFKIEPEVQPVLTEKQKRRLEKDPRHQKDPQLFIATSTHPMLPCRMLLTPDGRLLQLKMRIGTNEISYTLDDPIMTRRAERERKQKLQEGPRLLRPSWW